MRCGIKTRERTWHAFDTFGHPVKSLLALLVDVHERKEVDWDGGIDIEDEAADVRIES
jgi:hypothetical protein